MTTKTDDKGQIVTRTLTPADKLATMIEKMSGAMAAAVPKHVKPERLARVATTALRRNPDLAQCTPASFLGAMLTAAQLGLEVNTPLNLAYLIPFKKECTLIIGYQGYLDLARRSGMVAGMYAHVVRKGDAFDYELGLDTRLTHKVGASREMGDDGIVAVYAVAKLKDGDPIFVVLTRDEVEKRRARSHAAHKGPWMTDYEAMVKKTAIRALWPWLPKSAEMAQALVLEDGEERRAQSEAWTPEVVAALVEEGHVVESAPSDGVLTAEEEARMERDLAAGGGS